MSGERAGLRSAEDRAGLVIRAMTEADLPAVMGIERAVFTIPWTLATFRGLLGREQTRLWVAERTEPGGPKDPGDRREPGEPGEVVGYAAVWMVVDQAELGDLAVSEEWRGLGIGSRLLEVVLDAMASLGIRELYLEVRESNADAQRLYARYGFEEVGRRPGYYTRPKEDALVLRRPIEGPGGAPAQSRPRL